MNRSVAHNVVIINHISLKLQIVKFWVANYFKFAKICNGTILFLAKIGLLAKPLFAYSFKAKNAETISVFKGSVL